MPFSVENIDFSTMDSSEAQLAMMAMQGMMANYMMGGGDLDLSFDDAFTGAPRRPRSRSGVAWATTDRAPVRAPADGAGGRSSGNRRGRGRGGGRTASRGRDSGGQLSKRVPRVLVLGVPAANWERALGVVRAPQPAQRHRPERPFPRLTPPARALVSNTDPWRRVGRHR